MLRHTGFYRNLRGALVTVFMNLHMSLRPKKKQRIGVLMLRFAVVCMKDALASKGFIFDYIPQLQKKPGEWVTDGAPGP